jgi:5-methyltetrahydropteroyltriglutamate--homocysteine methyltransferase
MEQQHAYRPDTSFDGGDLDCGSGLLLLIRRHIDPLASGQTLEIISTDSTVEVDLPAWCRMTNNELLSLERRAGGQNSFLVRKGALAGRSLKAAVLPARPAAEDAAIDAPQIRPLSVMGMTGWQDACRRRNSRPSPTMPSARQSMPSSAQGSMC